MYRSTLHWRPLLNGYSGHYPVSYLELLLNVRPFPDDGSLRHLQRAGATVLVVHEVKGSQPSYEYAIERLALDPRIMVWAQDTDAGSRVTFFRLAPDSVGSTRSSPALTCRSRIGTGSIAENLWFDAWYSSTMRTTIDKAGRVVIPAAVRDRAGLTAGTELEITVDETGIRIERVAPGPKLVKVGRRLVARPTAPADSRPVLDIASLIEDERNRWP